MVYAINGHNMIDVCWGGYGAVAGLLPCVEYESRGGRGGDLRVYIDSTGWRWGLCGDMGIEKLAVGGGHRDVWGTEMYGSVETSWSLLAHSVTVD